MGRNTKEGIDYFPVQVKFNPTMKALLARVGNQGLGTIIRIWSYIYDNKGYYMVYDEDNKYVLADEVREDFDYVDEIIQLMIKKDLFSKKLFEKFNILTSESLQNNYKTATRKRVSSDIKSEYMLILDGRKTEESTQSKVKETKSNKITLNNTKEKEELQQKIAKLLSEEFNRILTNDEILIIKDWIDNENYSFDEIKDSLLIAIQRKVLNIKYIEGIIMKDREGFKELNKPDLIETIGG